MFVLNPDPFLLPSYRISPFKTEDIVLNEELKENAAINNYFNSRFGEKTFLYTETGRTAIGLALEYYQLQKDDVVTIFTTSGNFYISSCVTNEISKFCSWSRKIEARTKLIFVNHEFGHPYSDLAGLKEYGLPIIEDCASAFYSSATGNNPGTIGDFVIYSFPKMFPIQVGGLLKWNIANYPAEYRLNAVMENYIKKVLSYYMPKEQALVDQRIRNHQYLENRFEPLGFTSRFKLNEGAVPGVFMFRVANEKIDLPQLKEHFYSHGIQCSIFYGERSFFIPCHQALEKTDLDYFTAVMENFISKLN